MTNCPYCGRKVSETRGIFAAGRGRFVADYRGYMIRTSCSYCPRFLGYRRVESKKERKHV